MWNVQRIICIWICCVSCMFGSTQLSTLVAAVPYEYFDDHDQSFYDLDTEQIQAKYDTRLLSQHMLKPPEPQHDEQHTLESKKGSQRDGTFVDGGGVGDGGVTDGEHKERVHGAASIVLDTINKRNEGTDGSTDILSKLKTNDASTNSYTNKGNKDNAAAWLDETTPAITEKPEIHLPRAASCYTNGQKYTHGQKVPRHDSCEVCLCMDGEIFCWWEKCDKKPGKVQTSQGEDFSTPFGESSTMRIQANEKSTLGTTLRPMKKPKINKDYKYGRQDVQNGEGDIEDADAEMANDDDDGDDDDDDAAVILPTDEDTEYDDITQRHGKWPYKGHNSKQQMAKKKNYDEPNEAFGLKEKQMKQKKEKLKKQQQQQQQKAANDHHQYHHPDHHASSGSSKILNFPENLPSVLYYDYKTEEHQHHQHQHREQHLKHQHEKELKHRLHPSVRHHEYGNGQDTVNTDMSVTVTAVATSHLGNGHSIHDHGGSVGGNDAPLQRRQKQPPSVAKYLENGNDNIYKVDLQTDSDILPEPPTKKPILSSMATGTGTEADTMTSASAAGAPTTTTLPYRLSTLSSTLAAATSNITTRPLKNQQQKQMFSPWDYDKPNRDKINKRILQRQRQQQQLTSNENIATVAVTTKAAKDGDQDDAFHRWLTSTEKNNKNYDPLAGDASFEADDRNYENLDIDLDALSLQATAKTASPATQQIGAAAAAASAAVGEESQQLDKSGNLKYEINFSDNTESGYSAMDGNANSYDNISPFSNPYQNSRSSNRPTQTTGNGIKSQLDKGGKSHSGTLSTSSGGSNEDLGVGSVVNIDIMLTASADLGQQPQQQQQQTDTTKHQQTPGNDNGSESKQNQTNAKQQSLLISNSNGKDNDPLSPASLSPRGPPITPTNANTSPDSAKPQQTLGGNLFSSNFSSSISSVSDNSQSHSFSDSFRLSQPSESKPNATSFVTSASSAQITPPTSTTLSPERQCNVMGTLYKIGDVLPQDTGNCLQCICIDGSTIDDTPRVTCSPHNCPPLVLPDLFDATGY
ncbi:uncharacterized protein LOC106092652 [Stomoxys calcitrans]|uniref:uncharacterized protein LOC106092652 n=1 Tax=Stomoxys calcitrans TaxID=35570 RepID=UPI0027E2FF5B|nr:uncharacterized protein LOC106092652 [Stomoxys calcitrans]